MTYMGQIMPPSVVGSDGLTGDFSIIILNCFGISDRTHILSVFIFDMGGTCRGVHPSANIERAYSSRRTGRRHCNGAAVQLS